MWICTHGLEGGMKSPSGLSLKKGNRFTLKNAGFLSGYA
jgi:hypothetical protein